MPPPETRRVFCRSRRRQLCGWRTVSVRRAAALSYVASGGLQPQLYPLVMLPTLQRIDAMLDHAPALFATRLLVVWKRRPDNAVAILLGSAWS